MNEITKSEILGHLDRIQDFQEIIHIVVDKANVTETCCLKTVASSIAQEIEAIKNEIERT